jgi:DNA-binding winged helix-turn-helix (wHTH) protein
MTKSSECRSVGAFEFDLRTRELRDSVGRRVALRPQTSHILGFLIAHEGELVTKEDLMNEVWQGTSVTDDSLV